MGKDWEIWGFSPGILKLYTEDMGGARRIAAWKGCRFHATYHYPDGRVIKDVLLPSGFRSRAVSLLRSRASEKCGKSDDAKRRNAVA